MVVFITPPPNDEDRIDAFHYRCFIGKPTEGYSLGDRL
jgi:hypothetical protein